MGVRVFPLGVKLYSTFGGTTGNILQLFSKTPERCWPINQMK